MCGLIWGIQTRENEWESSGSAKDNLDDLWVTKARS